MTDELDVCENCTATQDLRSIDGEVLLCPECRKELHPNAEPDYKALVMDRYSDAYCGTGCDDRPCILTRQASPGVTADPIGRGDTEPLAWKAAYERMGE